MPDNKIFTTLRMETVLTFGKYKGKTVWWIYKNNPSYLVWALENINIIPTRQLVDLLETKGYTVEVKKDGRLPDSSRNIKKQIIKRK